MSTNQALPDDLHVTEVKDDETPFDAIQRIEAKCLADHELGFYAFRDSGPIYVRHVENSQAWVSAGEEELGSINTNEEDPDVDHNHMVVGYHTAEVNHQLSFAERVAIVPVKYLPFFGDGTLKDVDVFDLVDDDDFSVPM